MKKQTWPHRLILAWVAAGCALYCGASRAQSDTGVPADGRAKFVQCASCHGADGRSSVMPQYPKIAGQSAAYVVSALKAYREGRRQGTFAALMTEVAKPLSNADIANLAAYIESL